MSEKKHEKHLLNKLKSIQSIIFAAISIMVLFAVLIVTVVSMQYTRNTIFENSVMYTRTIINQVNQSIDSYIEYMDNIAYMFAKNEDVQKYLYTDDISDEVVERIVSQFDTILQGRSDIKNIGIIGDVQRALINDEDTHLNEDLDFESQEWYQNAMKEKEDSSISSSHVQHAVAGERPWVITVSRGIRNFASDGNKEGIFFIDLNYSAISELCDQNSIGKQGYVFILDGDGNVVYHPQQQQLYNELQTENIAVVLEAETDTVITGEDSEERLYTISRSEKTGWTVVGCVYVEELLAESSKAQSVYVVMAFALVAVSLILSSVISKKITRPLQRLKNAMAKVQEGDFDKAGIEVETENEIGSLTSSFNVMTEKIQELMQENVREQKEKRKSELKALQSQINPHFLYNTLDSIIWMAEGKKNEEVVLMTASLARLLRQSISNEEEVVPIWQEVEYVKSYLTIQKMRYKDKLEFEIEVAPSIRYINIIKLVLQPLIENAIYHGLKYKENKGMLHVYGYERGKDAVIEIIDNGVGMSKETLEHIFEKHKVNYHSNGVGVYNVQQRLQLYYGKDYGISYESMLGVGTTVTIVIPKNQEESHEEI